jgi:hypothetical protein
MLKLKYESILLAALVLIIIAVTCHYKSYLSEKFYVDPNRLYTRYGNGVVENSNTMNGSDSATTKFSRTYRQSMGGSNYDSKFCQSSILKDPCTAVLNDQANIPANIIKECNDMNNSLKVPAPTPASSSLQNITEDEMDALVYKYAVLTSQRDSLNPWNFNHIGSPSISI